jgi:hypothetical protein
LILKRLSFLALTLALGLPSTAGAYTRLALPDGSTLAKEQGWVDRALVPTPNVTVAMFLAPCPEQFDGDVEACTYVDAPITIYFDPAHHPDRFGFLHEIGHIFDATLMTDVDRIRFRAIMHDTNPDWWGQYPDVSDYDNPGERFADAYSLCALRRRLVADSLDNDLRWHGPNDGSGYDYFPTEFQHRKVCKLIQSASRQAPVVAADLSSSPSRAH